MIDVKKITSGSMNGEYVWIYDLRYNDFNNKPIRKVLPQKVFVRCNSECTKKIYYSSSHFLQLNKKGEPTKSKILGVFDNTGYRSYPGVPVNIFGTKKECFKSFNKDLGELIEGAEAWKKLINKKANIIIRDLRDLVF